MGTSQEVVEQLPGLQFRVESFQRGRETAAGTHHGTIQLHCEMKEWALFDEAVKKLNGFKMFSSLAEELTDALAEELNNTAQTLGEAQQEIEALRAEGAEKDAEIARLRGLLQDIEADL